MSEENNNFPPPPIINYDSKKTHKTSESCSCDSYTKAQSYKFDNAVIRFLVRMNILEVSKPPEEVKEEINKLTIDQIKTIKLLESADADKLRECFSIEEELEKKEPNLTKARNMITEVYTKFQAIDQCLRGGKHKDIKDSDDTVVVYRGTRDLTIDDEYQYLKVPNTALPEPIQINSFTSTSLGEIKDNYLGTETWIFFIDKKGVGKVIAGYSGEEEVTILFGTTIRIYEVRRWDKEKGEFVSEPYDEPPKIFLELINKEVIDKAVENAKGPNNKDRTIIIAKLEPN